MARSIFVTGAGGFIGKIVLRRLASSADCTVKAMIHRPQPQGASAVPGVQYLVGDLLKPETYRAALAGSDVILHLAAVTGRAAPDAYEAVNVDGTSALLQACEAEGVRQFLHVSTIAAGYRDQSHYHYAKTKARAEVLVRESGLDFAIVRPTIVLGEQSPIWITLLKIAKLPVIPLPEHAGPVMVQPIRADDVARGIELLLASGRFNGEVLELGGPRPLPLREFLTITQKALRGAAGKIVSVPLWLFQMPLALVEPMLRPLLPVTAGQLAIFANDSTASENWLLAQLRTDMPRIEDTVAALVSAPGAGPGGGSKANPGPPARDARPMTETSKRVLEEECETFSRYLTSTAPSPYITEQYVRATQAHGVAFDELFSCFDRATLRLARSGRVRARWADAYCGLLHRAGVLRRKLIVLAAILEHVAPTSDVFDRVTPRRPTVTVLSIAVYGVMAATALAFGAVILLPAKVLCWFSGRTRTAE